MVIVWGFILASGLRCLTKNSNVFLVTFWSVLASFWTASARFGWFRPALVSDLEEKPTTF